MQLKSIWSLQRFVQSAVILWDLIEMNLNEEVWVQVRFVSYHQFQNYLIFCLEDYSKVRIYSIKLMINYNNGLFLNFNESDCNSSWAYVNK